MEWTHISSNASTMLDEQWVLRRENRTICTLRVSGRNEWVASLLLKDGIGTSMLHIHGGSLEQAKADCISELKLGGWPIE